MSIITFISSSASRESGWGDFQTPDRKVIVLLPFIFFLDIFQKLSLFSLHTSHFSLPGTYSHFPTHSFLGELLISRNCKVTQYDMMAPISNTQSHCPHKSPATCQTAHPDAGCRPQISSSSCCHLSRSDLLSHTVPGEVLKKMQIALPVFWYSAFSSSCALSVLLQSVISTPQTSLKCFLLLGLTSYHHLIWPRDFSLGFITGRYSFHCIAVLSTETSH